MGQGKGRRLGRVDLQVSMLAAALVAVSVLCMYFYQYTLAHGDMLRSLENKVQGIYEYVESVTEEEDFTAINTREDEAGAQYRGLKAELERVRRIAGVRYLYTAKQAQDGSFVYLVDGLDDQAEDFRHAGDPIEAEIHPQMRRALAGETLLPDDILATSWGDVFVSYYPIHAGDGRVVGVLGVEIDASHQYDTYRLMRMGSLLIGILLLAASVLVAVLLFRRISNPSYRDLANTDYLTGCKNRNAFEVDLGNLHSARRQEKALLASIDLNGLKKINDTVGHAGGDELIRRAADLLRRALLPGMVLYRVGGDEFAILAQAPQEEAELQLRGSLQAALAARGGGVSLSMGTARFDPAKDKDLLDTYRRADLEMYGQKRRFYGGGPA